MTRLTKLLSAAAFIIVSNGAFAQQGKTITDTTYTINNLGLQGFTGIRIQGPYDVYVTQGDGESVKMDAPAEILPRIITEVKAGVLNIQNKHDNWGWGERSWWSERSWWHTHKRIAVYITAKNLDDISISGSAAIFFWDGITASSLNLSLSGSGKIEGKIDSKTVRANMSGSGRILLTGSAASSDVTISGSGNFSARGLVTANSSVHVSGSGHAEVNAGETVDASVHGSAHISYTGNAKVVNSSKSGSGAISRL